MQELLLDICKRKIDHGMSFGDILDFVKSKNLEGMFSEIEQRLKEYIDKQSQIVFK